MQLEDYFDFQRPDDIRVKGTRVCIETILYDFIHLNRDMSIGQSMDELILIAEAFVEDEYQDQIVHLPLPSRG